VVCVIINKNDNIKLNIEAMTSEGSAVGHYEGMAVFVRGAVVGDEIIAHIIKVSKRYCIGIVKEIIKKSPHRIDVDCPVADKCGGCSFRNMTYDEEVKYKLSRVNDALKRIGHLDIETEEIISADNVNHYRNKAQYPVSIVDGELTAGFYAYKSHRIIPCNDCKLQSDDFKSVLDAFSTWVKNGNITSYDENTGKGILRHIYIRKAFATNEIMACAVVNSKTLPSQALLVDELKKIENVKSICYNINTKNSNVILGDEKKLFLVVILFVIKFLAKALLFLQIHFIRLITTSVKSFIQKQ
jgi:23S rRNA (uracil1939-C5)-methyltransferase